MAIETPCTQICLIEPQRGYCLGCGRSLSEIESWIGLSDRERSRIMADLPRRLAASPEAARAYPEH